MKRPTVTLWYGVSTKALHLKTSHYKYIVDSQLPGTKNWKALSASCENPPLRLQVDDIPKGKNVANVVTKQDDDADPKEVAHVGKVDETQSGDAWQQLVKEVGEPGRFEKINKGCEVVAESNVEIHVAINVILLHWVSYANAQSEARKALWNNATEKYQRAVEKF